MLARYLLVAVVLTSLSLVALTRSFALPPKRPILMLLQIYRKVSIFLVRQYKLVSLILRAPASNISPSAALLDNAYCMKLVWFGSTFGSIGGPFSTFVGVV